MPKWYYIDTDEQRLFVCPFWGESSGQRKKGVRK
jgi:hypothetical protein